MPKTDKPTKDKHIGHIAGLVTAAVTGTMRFILGGTIAGTLIGKLHDNGITDKFLKSLEKEVQPNTSALVLFGRSNPQGRERILQRLAALKPKVLESDLPPAMERALQKALQDAAEAQPIR